MFFDWNVSVAEVLEKLKAILIYIKEHLSNQNEQDKVTKAFVFSIYNIIIKITNYYESYQNIENLEVLFSIYKQVIDQAQVSFEGEPLTRFANNGNFGKSCVRFRKCDHYVTKRRKITWWKIE